MGQLIDAPLVRSFVPMHGEQTCFGPFDLRSAEIVNVNL